jgi:hypothetical protein
MPMKNNKKLTYLLLVLSIVVWGIAGWKVYKAFHTETPLPVTKSNLKPMPTKEQTTLLLNYKDPFLGGYAESTTTTDAATTTPRKNRPQLAVVQTPPPEESPNIRFKGVMHVGNNTLAILQTNSATINLKVGESVNDYKLTHVDDQKIVLRKGKKRYEIPIQ